MARDHHTPERITSGDKVYTPEWAARDLVRHFKPTGRVLEPCRGNGAIYRHLPPGSPWCEIDEGVDFFAFKERVDWIITNPPYSQTRKFMRHGFIIADNVVLLVPARNIVSGYGTVRECIGYGGLREIRWYGTGAKLGFPMGNAIAAFHWQRGWVGETTQTFYEDDEVTEEQRMNLEEMTASIIHEHAGENRPDEETCGRLGRLVVARILESLPPTLTGPNVEPDGGRLGCAHDGPPCLA